VEEIWIPAELSKKIEIIFRHIYKSKMSLEYYKKKNAQLQKEKAYAWGMYFGVRNKLFEAQEEIYDYVNKDRLDFESNNEESAEHLQKFISELYEKARESVECPICMERIDAESLDTTKCGHNFHKECLNTLKDTREVGSKFVDCPICRTKLWAIKSK